jgi:predicted PurR-regulated permease PerM
MHLFEPDQSRNLNTLIRVFTVLGVLLIAVAIFALLGDILSLLGRFQSVVYLFLLGALLAYLMAPVARVMQRVVRKAWIAVVSAYMLLLIGVLAFGALLLTPFVTQAQSLVKGLRNPSAASLAPLRAVQQDLDAVKTDLSAQQHLLTASHPIPQNQVQQTQAIIARLAGEVSRLTIATNRPGVVPLPPSYAAPIVATVSQLQAAYGQVTATPDTDRVAKAVAAAAQASTQADTQAATAYRKAASTPLLLLGVQTTLDQHNIAVDLHDRFSQVLQAVNDQVSSILNNALGIGQQALNTLLDLVLIFIISIYFLRDGARLVRRLVQLAPPGSRSEVASAVESLDQILGSYIRTQFVLAFLAGLSDAVGALILGVPYAVVIFFSSFFLSLVPVIGPVILPFPPMAIALIFTPLPTPLLYLAWLLIGEQIITNVVGPRLQGHNLRIHPLEAMAAALVGLPLAGLAGAFFAVPIVAFFHIAIREFARARHLAVPGTGGDGAGSRSPPGPAKAAPGSRPGA